MPNQENIVVGAANIVNNGSDVGFTQGGVTVRYDLTVTEVDADQQQGIAARRKSNERVFVSFNLLEITLENIRSSMALPAELLIGGTCLYLGYNSSCGDELFADLILSGEGPSCCNRTWRFPCSVVSEGFELSIQKDAAQQMSVTYEALKCDSGNAPSADFEGRFGVVCDNC